MIGEDDDYGGKDFLGPEEPRRDFLSFQEEDEEYCSAFRDRLESVLKKKDGRRVLELYRDVLGPTGGWDSICYAFNHERQLRLSCVESVLGESL